MDRYGRPEDYDELVRRYYGMAKRVVSASVAPGDVEDVTQEVLLKFVAKDWMAKYDPNLEINGRFARFPTFFRSFSSSFVRTPAEKVRRDDAREMLLCDAPTENGEAWIEVYAPVISLGEESVDMNVEVVRARRLLGTVVLAEEVTAADVFDVMLEEGAVRSTQVPIRALARRFDVSLARAAEWRTIVVQRLTEIGFMRTEPGWA